MINKNNVVIFDKKKWKLFIRKYDIFLNDYIVQERIIEGDLFHEIGKIYSNEICRIDRISYQEIKEINNDK